MSTSRSSASETESFAENDVSFEESVEDSSHHNNSGHYHHEQSPMHQQTTRPKHYFVDNSNIRYVVSNGPGSSSNIAGNNISLMPNYQVKGNSLLPSSQQQYGSQYFMDNSVIHRTYSYYNQPQLNHQKYPGNYKDFLPQKNPDIVSVRYIAQPAAGNNGSLFREQPFVAYPPNSYPYMPNAPGNFKERRIVFGRDSYGTEQNFYYPNSFYNNQAYEVGSQRVLNYDINQIQSGLDHKRMKTPHEQMKQIENHEAVSSQWNMSGGFGNTYGVNQKFYKELIENSNQPNFNQFYPENPSINNSKKDKRNYLGFTSADSSTNKRVKFIVLCIILALIILGVISLIVFGAILPKHFYSANSIATVASLAAPNMTLNDTDFTLGRINKLHTNLSNGSISLIENKTALNFNILKSNKLVDFIEPIEIKNDSNISTTVAFHSTAPYTTINTTSAEVLKNTEATEVFATEDMLTTSTILIPTVSVFTTKEKIQLELNSLFSTSQTSNNSFSSVSVSDSFSDSTLTTTPTTTTTPTQTPTQTTAILTTSSAPESFTTSMAFDLVSSSTLITTVSSHERQIVVDITNFTNTNNVTSPLNSTELIFSTPEDVTSISAIEKISPISVETISMKNEGIIFVENNYTTVSNNITIASSTSFLGNNLINNTVIMNTTDVQFNF